MKYFFNMNTQDQHPDYPDGKLPRKLIEALALSEGAKEMFEDKIDELRGVLADLEKFRSETQLGLIEKEKDPEYAAKYDIELSKLLVEDTYSDQKKKVMARLKKFNRLFDTATDTVPDCYKRIFDLDVVRSVPISELIDVAGGRVSGGRTTIHCPFHDEKTPSFVIFHDNNHAHCFGCGWHGDNIKLIMDLEGLTFPQACRRILSHSN